MSVIQKDYKVISAGHTFYFNAEETGIDLVQQSDTDFHCISNHRSVTAILLDADAGSKKFRIAIEGEIYAVEIKDALDQQLEQMGFGTATNKKLINIKAPMPGLVLEISVADGQTVHAGDKILILEAMKMENSIVIPASAVIRKVLVTKGQAVDYGQVLVELGPVESE
jgi:biotin carboxyl carrier protein